MRIDLCFQEFDLGILVFLQDKLVVFERAHQKDHRPQNGAEDNRLGTVEQVVVQVIRESCSGQVIPFAEKMQGNDFFCQVTGKREEEKNNAKPDKCFLPAKGFKDAWKDKKVIDIEGQDIDDIPGNKK
jgi:hypothetical protein